MPNHVTNRLKIHGSKEDIAKVLDFIKYEEDEYNDKYSSGIGTIDFNKITPTPPWIYGYHPILRPNVMGISCKDEEKYGSENTSIEWCYNNWGTKWNAYSQPDYRNEEDTIYFQTAWSGVPELMQKIAWMFPNVIVEYSYCDEDFGYNIGKYKFQDTQVLEEYSPVGATREAYELAMEIEQCTPLEKYLLYVPNINNYRYDENVGDDFYDRYYGTIFFRGIIFG